MGENIYFKRKWTNTENDFYDYIIPYVASKLNMDFMADVMGRSSLPQSYFRRSFTNINLESIQYDWFLLFFSDQLSNRGTSLETPT